MGHINIEIKARCSEHDRIREILKAEGADYKGTDHQIDVYFNVPNGRMKLRKGVIENHLIHYERENQEGPKQSNVILFDSDTDSSLETLLTKALGVAIVVDKQREIYFIENVKFHIDIVKELGTFVEIEAIDKEGNIGIETLNKQCEYYQLLLRIKPEDLISCSYSDLLLEKQNK